MAKLNNNNFLIWYDSLPVDNCYYALPMVQGDVIKGYTNFIEVRGGSTFYQLDLYSEDLGTVIHTDIATLNDITADGGQQIYFEYTVIDLPKGVYRFKLKDTFSDDYYSNRFLSTSNTENTSVIKYRNSENAFDTLYEEIPTFYNQVRVDLRTGNADFNENVRGYETYQGDFINVKSDVQKLVEFNTRFFDENAHDAFFSMLAHSEFYIDDVRYKKPAQSSYQIEWSDFDDERIGNGSINLIEFDYSSSIRNC